MHDGVVIAGEVRALRRVRAQDALERVRAIDDRRRFEFRHQDYLGLIVGFRELLDDSATRRLHELRTAGR